MGGLLFTAGIAVLLGLAQLLGLAADSRDGRDWHPREPEHRADVVPLRPRRHRPAA
ncbi:hypothetical protein [Actinocatenispora rupis]|uniref:Uncharacterized protein n=1 Tax=Actinocatenispora rupis TaxID=519421 RepID=A0A8J3JFN3_9ACTN|nr:hypothetical protein [Actinocatenispora rupis]GID15073.1 hypothetical protein Aru02nite_59620 [Actinocatenispora rupis]